MERLIHDVYGNGQEGLLSECKTFFAEYRENRKNNIEFQNQRDAENAKRESRRWKVLGFVLSLLTVVVAVLTYLEANRQIHGNFTVTQPNAALQSQQQPQDSYK